MKLEKSAKRYHAIVVDEDDLLYLYNYIKDNFQDIKIKCECADGTKFDTKDINDLIKYENPRFRRLISIQFQTSNDPIFPELEIKLCEPAYPFKGSCSYSLNLDDHRNASAIEPDLIARFDELRPWYSFFSRIDYVLLVVSLPFIYVLASSFGTLVAKLQGYTFDETSSVSMFDNSEALILVVAIIGVFIVVGTLLNYVRDFIFPVCIFVVGKEKKRHESRKTIHYVLFIVISLGFIINYLSNYLLY